MEEQPAEISEREREILELVATGATNQQVARALHISPNTVKVHLRNIFAKLQVESRTEAALYAVQQGWVELPGAEAVPSEPAIPAPAGARHPPIGPWRRALLLVSIAVVTLALWFPTPQAAGPGTWREDFAEVPGSAASAGPYRPGASRWLSRAQMPTPRGRLAVAVLDDLLYAIGGTSHQGPTGRVEVYDPTDDTWRNAPPLPTPAANIQAAALDGKIFVPGGYDASGDFLDLLQVYDPLTGTWSQAHPLPQPRAGYALATCGGDLYLFGGSDGQAYQADAYRYSPTEDQWTRLPPMGTARGFAGAATLDGQVYVTGGYDGQRELALCERFDPVAAQWHPCAPLRTPRGGLALVAMGQSLYAIGGGWQTYLAFNEKYSPATDSWTTFETPILAEWRLLGAAPLGSYLYAAGGVSGRYLSALQAYQTQFRLILPVTP